MDKKDYKKPTLNTEKILETVALECGKAVVNTRGGTCNGGLLSS